MASLDWKLLPWQLEVWQAPQRFKVIVAGRRTGKSNLSIKKIIAAGLEAPKGSAVLYVGPTQAQTRQIAWDAIIDQGRDVIKASHVNSMDITLINGVKIHLRSAENPDTLRGLKLYFVVIDEAAFIKDQKIWTESIRPALSDLKGEAWFISSPAGRNWLYDLYKYALEGKDPEWGAWHKTTFDNPTIDPKEIEAAKRTLSSFSFKAEYLASFDTAGADLFKPEWIKEGSIPDDGSYVIAIDLAGFENISDGSQNKKRLDETAMAVVKIGNDNKWYVDKIEHGRWDIKDTCMRILKNIKEYQPTQIGIERGTAMNAVMGVLQDMMRQYNTFAHIQTLTHGNKKKTDRIVWALQGRFEHGHIVLNEDEDFEEFKDQLIMFPTKGVHDDLVDALAYVEQLAISAFLPDYEEEDYEVFDTISGY